MAADGVPFPSRIPPTTRAFSTVPCSVTGPPLISDTVSGNKQVTGWSFCTKASERVYITADDCEFEFGGTRERRVRSPVLYSTRHARSRAPPKNKKRHCTNSVPLTSFGVAGVLPRLFVRLEREVLAVLCKFGAAKARIRHLSRTADQTPRELSSTNVGTDDFQRRAWPIPS